MKINAATHLEHTRRWAGAGRLHAARPGAAAVQVPRRHRRSLAASRRARSLRPGLIAGPRPGSLAHPDRRTPAASNSGVLTGRLLCYMLTRTRRHAMMGVTVTVLLVA
jgi:hypothetical protein